MVQHWAARWMMNDYVQQSSVIQMLIDLKWQHLAQRWTDARHSLMYKIVHNLIPIEAIKYVKLQRNLINLQQILANKYYEMSCFPHTKTGIPYQKPYWPLTASRPSRDCISDCVSLLVITWLGGACGWGQYFAPASHRPCDEWPPPPQPWDS